MKTPIYPLGEIERIQAPKGAIGELMTLPIDRLQVDDTYQRAVSQNSIRNVRKIAKDFDWSKFIPVIVVRDGDMFSIVDGQHRTTSAASIGITHVPCYVLSCSYQEAAAAFAAINGNVTPVTPIDIWFSSIAAQDPKSLLVKRVLDASNVTITRRKDGFRVGETRSINVIIRAYEFYGDALLTTILQCITETGDGNPGMIVGSVINGIGRAIRSKPEMLANPAKLLDIFDEIDLTALMESCRTEYARTNNPVQFVMTRKINEALVKTKQREAA